MSSKRKRKLLGLRAELVAAKQQAAANEAALEVAAPTLALIGGGGYMGMNFEEMVSFSKRLNEDRVIMRERYAAQSAALLDAKESLRVLQEKMLQEKAPGKRRPAVKAIPKRRLNALARSLPLYH